MVAHVFPAEVTNILNFRLIILSIPLYFYFMCGYSILILSNLHINFKDEEIEVQRG